MQTPLPSPQKWTCPQICFGYVSEHFQPKKKLVKFFWNNFIKIDFSKNSRDTFFVDLFNLNNFDISEIFWEINISRVIGRVHFSSQNFSNPNNFTEKKVFFLVGNVLKRAQKNVQVWLFLGREGGSAYRIVSQTRMK